MLWLTEYFFLVQNQRQVHSVPGISSPYRERQCFAQKKSRVRHSFRVFFLSFLRFIRNLKNHRDATHLFVPILRWAGLIKTSSPIRFLYNLNFFHLNIPWIMRNFSKIFTKQLTLEISKILFCWIRRKLLVEKKQNTAMFPKGKFWKKKKQKDFEAPISWY